MRKTVIAIVSAIVFAIGGSTTASAKVDYNPNVAPITCPDFADDCVLRYVDRHGEGYWMARTARGTTWVRLTLVPGWTTTGVGRITCAYYASCVIGWTKSYPGEGYYMARFPSSSTWVRLTMVNGN